MHKYKSYRYFIERNWLSTYIEFLVINKITMQRYVMQRYVSMQRYVTVDIMGFFGLADSINKVIKMISRYMIFVTRVNLRKGSEMYKKIFQMSLGQGHMKICQMSLGLGHI